MTMTLFGQWNRKASKYFPYSHESHPIPVLPLSVTISFTQPTKPLAKQTKTMRFHLSGRLNSEVSPEGLHGLISSFTAEVSVWLEGGSLFEGCFQLLK